MAEIDSEACLQNSTKQELDNQNSALDTAYDTGTTPAGVLACQLDIGRFETALRAVENLAATISERSSDSQLSNATKGLHIQSLLRSDQLTEPWNNASSAIPELAPSPPLA